MKYLSIAQTAERWGISTRRIQILCGEGRVPGAIRIGTVWLSHHGGLRGSLSAKRIQHGVFSACQTAP